MWYELTRITKIYKTLPLIVKNMEQVEFSYATGEVERDAATLEDYWQS